MPGIVYWQYDCYFYRSHGGRSRQLLLVLVSSLAMLRCLCEDYEEWHISYSCEVFGSIFSQNISSSGPIVTLQCRSKLCATPSPFSVIRTHTGHEIIVENPRGMPWKYNLPIMWLCDFSECDILHIPHLKCDPYLSRISIGRLIAIQVPTNHLKVPTPQVSFQEVRPALYCNYVNFSVSHSHVGHKIMFLWIRKIIQWMRLC